MKDPFPRPVRVFFTLAAGALAMIVTPPLLEALTAPGVPALWWVARASGLVAYLALWLSSLFGAFVASRGAGGLLDPATVLELHTRWALAALVGTTVHVLAVIGDGASHVSPGVVLAPLSAWSTPAALRGPVALGVFALWGMGLVAVTTALLRRLPRAAWRAVHASAFGVLVLALVHGLAAGSETRVPLVRALYGATAAVLLAALIQRLLLTRWPGSGSQASSRPTTRPRSL